MVNEPNQPCAEFESLLTRKVTGELVPEEENSLGNHLAQCATCNSELENISRQWQGMDLPSFAVPAKLHDETQKAVLGLLKQERFIVNRFAGGNLRGAWSYLLPTIAGLVMTTLSYVLVASLIDHRVHHHYIVIVVFSIWAMLFVVASGLMFGRKDDRISSVSAVIAFSLSITFITLVFARLFSWSEFSGWIEGSWIDLLFSDFLPESGHRFVLGWGSYACAASFFGALFFGLHKAMSFSEAVFLGSLFVSVLLFPILYLHGLSHSHGIGVILSGGLGVFFASSAGNILGSTIRRQFSFSVI